MRSHPPFRIPYPIFWAVVAAALLLVPLLAHAAPSLTIFGPREGWIFEDGQEVAVRFETGGYLFVDYADNRERYPANLEAGHGHLWVDPPQGELNHDAARKLLSADTPVSLGVLSRGEHEIVIELTANNHAPLTPPVVRTRAFFVGGRISGASGGEGDVTPFSRFGSGLILLVVLVLLLLYHFRREGAQQIIAWFKYRKNPKT